MATPQEARRAADVHADDLSAHPNVVGVGTQPVENTAGVDHAVAVYVSRKVPDAQLRAEERLPTTVDVATRGGTAQVPVVVVEIGQVTPDDADDPYTAE